MVTEYTTVKSKHDLASQLLMVHGQWTRTLDLRLAKDKTREDKTRQDKTRQDKTRHDKTRQEKT